jgi:hypothetical protein
MDAPQERQTGGILTKGDKELLTRIYFDVKNEASFSSAAKLQHASGLSKKKVDLWLTGQDAHTLHKKVIRKFKRNRYVVHNMGILCEADLIDCQKIKDQNDSMTFILILIDVFSKKIWVEPLKNKSGPVVAEAFKKILARAPHFLRLRSDKGLEFKCAPVQAVLKKNKIQFSTTENSDIKCAVVERAIQTWRNRMSKYFTHFGVERYIHILQDLAAAYNSSIHSATKFRPDDVNIDTAPEVWNNLYSGRGRYPELDLFPTSKPKIPVGSDVRISKEKSIFRKGSERGWTRETFKVKKQVNRAREVYKLHDLADEEISGHFYKNEIQPVTVDGAKAFKIREILDTKGRGRNRRLLVAYEGWPDKFNNWISDAELVNLQ